MNTIIETVNTPTLLNPDLPYTIEFNVNLPISEWFVERYLKPKSSPFGDKLITIIFNAHGAYDNIIPYFKLFYSELRNNLYNNKDFQIISKSYKNRVLDYEETLFIKEFRLNYHESGFYNGIDCREYIELEILPKMIRYENK